MSRTTFTSDIRTFASRYGLEANLVEALIIIESGGNPWALNPEPRYRWLWNVMTREPYTASSSVAMLKTPPDDFPSFVGDRDQEWWAQQCSWGLMQVMGALARELDVRVPYLTELCRPELNMDVGCQHLSSLMHWAGRDEAKALAAYNAGKGNIAAGAQYATKVLARKQQLQREGGL